MKDIFKGFDLELKMNNVCYEVDKASIDALKHLTIVLPVIENISEEAELIVCGTGRLFASAKIKIKESRTDNDKMFLICHAPPQNFHFFQRNFLRLNINIPVNYMYLKAESFDTLAANSDLSPGMLIDISPCGALLLFSKQENGLKSDDPDSATFLKLCFTLTDELGKEVPMEIISKVVNSKKTWSSYYVGVLFLVASFNQYRILEGFYKERIANQKVDTQERADYFFKLHKIS